MVTNKLSSLISEICKVLKTLNIIEKNSNLPISGGEQNLKNFFKHSFRGC